MNNKKWRQASSLLEALLQAKQAQKDSAAKLADVQLQLLRCYVKQFRFQDAQSTLSQLMVAYDHEPRLLPKTIDDLTLLAEQCVRSKDYMHAERLYKTAIQIEEKNHGKDNANVVPLMVSIGSVYLKEQKIDEAEPYLEKAYRLEKEKRSTSPGFKPNYAADRLWVEYLRKTGRNDAANDIVRALKPGVRARFFPFWVDAPPLASRESANASSPSVKGPNARGSVKLPNQPTPYKRFKGDHPATLSF